MTTEELTMLEALIAKMQDAIDTCVCSEDDDTSAAAWDALTGPTTAQIAYVKAHLITPTAS